MRVSPDGSAEVGPYPRLPPGHEPGRQSKRAARGRRLGVIVLSIFAVCLLLGGVAFFLASSGSSSPKNRQIGAVVFGLGLLLGAIPVWMVRRARRERATFVTVQADRLELTRGDTVTVTMRVLDDSKVQGELQLGLVCIERWDKQTETIDSAGNTTTQRTTTATTIHQQWEAVPGIAQYSASFTIPPELPYSYEGDCVSYAWRVSVRQPSRLRVDPHADQPLWVSP